MTATLIDRTDEIVSFLNGKPGAIWVSQIRSHFSYIYWTDPDGVTWVWLANLKFGIHFVGDTD